MYAGFVHSLLKRGKHENNSIFDERNFDVRALPDVDDCKGIR